MLRKLFLLFLLVLVSTTVSAWSITPVGPNDPIRPDGTVIKKVIGSSTFAYDEMSAAGGGTTVTDPNSGFVTVATPSFNVLTTAKTDIAALLPTGTTGFILYAYNGDLVIGPSSGISTGTMPVGVIVASGTFVKWDGLVGGTNNISAYGNTGTVNCRLVAW